MALDVISRIDLDLKAPNAEKVYAEQYDSGGHIVAQLLNEGQPWEVPSGADAIILFRKSDNIGGYYDTTYLGEIAVSFGSNRSIISIALDPQVLVTAGLTNIQVSFIKNDIRISTFAFILQVNPSVLTKSNIESKWFVNLLRASNIVVDDTLTALGYAADAKIVGDRFATTEATILNVSSSMQQSIANEISRASEAENLKVNKPIESPNGTVGQLLRTLGNGQTEWTDQGTPSESQVGTAVTSWLNAHPEATTTVLDNSLSIKKMQTGTLGYVTPETYGAVGDGSTDDTAAFQVCLNSGERIFIPKKQYNITEIIFGNNCEIIEDLGIYTNFKPFYKRKFDTNFTKFYKSGSVPMPNEAYDEGIAFDSAIQKYVIAYNHHTSGSENTILLVVNPSTFVVEASYEYPLSTPNGISYNPYTDEILLVEYGTNSGTHRIDGISFEYKGLLGLPQDLPEIQSLYTTYFDPITRTYAVIPHTGTAYPLLEIPIRIYDETFNLLKTTTYMVDEAYVGQYYEYYDGKLYKANWDNFLEIDAFTGEYKRIDTSGYFEIEGSCHDGDGVMHIVAHDSAGGKLTHIYSYSDLHIKSWNLKDRYNRCESYTNIDLNQFFADGDYYIEITDTTNLGNYNLPDGRTKGLLVIKSVAKNGTTTDGTSQTFTSTETTNKGTYTRFYSTASHGWSQWFDIAAYTPRSQAQQNPSYTGYNSLWITVYTGTAFINGYFRLTADPGNEALFTNLPRPLTAISVPLLDLTTNKILLATLERNTTELKKDVGDFAEAAGHILQVIGSVAYCRV